MNECLKKENHYEIILNRKHKGICLIDVEDYDLIKQYTWTLNKIGYVRASINKKDALLHRFLFNVTDTKVLVHHINHNTLDNRRCNLMIANKSINAMDKIMQSNNTSGVIGVYWAKENDREHRWKAVITVYKKTINLGRYRKLEDAIKARKEGEIKYFGEYRNKN